MRPVSLKRLGLTSKATNEEYMVALKKYSKPTKPKSWKSREKLGMDLTTTQENKRLKYWVDKLDKLFSIFIRSSSKKCVLCPNTSNLQNGHIISRRNKAVRWDEMNCHVQCAGCNIKHNTEPQHYINWFIGKYGMNEWMELCNRAKEVKRWKWYELKELCEKYK